MTNETQTTPILNPSPNQILSEEDKARAYAQFSKEYDKIFPRVVKIGLGIGIIHFIASLLNHSYYIREPLFEHCVTSSLIAFVITFLLYAFLRIKLGYKYNFLFNNIHYHHRTHHHNSDYEPITSSSTSRNYEISSSCTSSYEPSYTSYDHNSSSSYTSPYSGSRDIDPTNPGSAAWTLNH